MGLFTTLFARHPAAKATANRLTKGPRRAHEPRRTRFEQCEQRQLLAADVMLGSVYFEEATGDDSEADTIQISFVGGADGTTLDRLLIDGDKLGDGLTSGDIFFDTSPSDPGSFGSVGYALVSSDGFDVTGVEVLDGGLTIAFNFSGFEAGEELVFTIDVDEWGVTRDGPNPNPLAEGAEFEGTVITGDFSAPGFVDLTLESIHYDAFDDDFSAAETATGGVLTELPEDAYEAADDKSDRTAGAVAYAPQLELARLSGHVYHDLSDDGVFDPTEGPIAGVTVELLDASGQATGRTTTTNAEGYYEFKNLEAGVWGVRETQPDGWYDGKDTAGSHGGVVTNDLITGVELAYGDRAVDYDFGELLGGSIAGRVHVDTDGDCDFDDPDVLLEGVVIELLSPSGQVLATTTTDDQGRYRFNDLRPGEYQVRERQPEGYYDGDERVGSAGGRLSNDLVSGVVIGSGERAVDYDFCEHVGANLSGHVYHDRSDDGVFDPTEDPIAGVTVELLDATGSVVSVTTTNAEGYYEFTNLDAGVWGVREFQPDGWLDGKDTAGSHGGAVTNDRITQVVLGYGDDATDYNFGELLAGSIAGVVHADTNGDCDFDNPEILLEGVVIELLDESGAVIATTTTDENGAYRFDGLEPGKYSVHEVQPAGYYDGAERVGTAGGLLANDLVTQIDIGSDQQAVNYDFCELLGASIAGRVHASTDGECDFEDPDILLEGVVMELLSPSGEVLATTTTDAEGRYRFDDLRPGEYQVREVQPEGYYDGDEHAGTAGGLVSDDLISAIHLGSAVAATRYDFCEHLGADLSGYVYHDRSNDGSRDPGEEPIAGVTLKLLLDDGTDTGQRAVTDGSGFYQFTNLAAGKYRVMEVHPTGWLDGIDTAGSHGGTADNPGDMIRTIMLGYGDDAINYNFGELKPGSIAGSVHASDEPDCRDDEDAVPLAGVVIELLDGSGAVVATTTTDANGDYQFDNLDPGKYSVREQQPTGYFDGSAHRPGTNGVVTGPNAILGVTIGSGEAWVDYDFCETPPAKLAGYVFIDGLPIVSNVPLPEDLSGIRDGKRTADDTPLAGVRLRLVNGTTGAGFYQLKPGETVDDVPEGMALIETLPGFYADGVFETVTDANGYYEFDGLPGGPYAVVEVSLGGQSLIDGIDTPGSTGGDAVNPGDGRTALHELFDAKYGADVIYSVSLTAGDFSIENNFSEVQQTPIYIPPKETPDPPAPPVFLPSINGVLPTPPPALTPPPEDPIASFGGSSQVIGYTWHLSVINAGQPREATAPGGPEMRFASQSVDTTLWQHADRSSDELREAKWRLLASDIEGAELSEFLFGHADATPVSGDWNGDGVTDIGVYLAGDWYLDLDGDGRWDRDDLWAHLGSRDDLPVTGDWDGDGKTDIGIFGPAWSRDPHAVRHDPGMPDAANWPGPIAGKAKNVPPTAEEATSGGRLLRQPEAVARRTDLIDHVFYYGAPGDAPVAGDWNGDGIRTIGVFRDGLWRLDTNGDGRLDDGDRAVSLGRPGDEPIVGDWDGDGIDDLGVYRDGDWLVDADGDGAFDTGDDATDRAFAASIDDAPTGKPITGDWDGDGADEPGVYTPAEGSARADGEVRVSRRAG